MRCLDLEWEMGDLTLYFAVFRMCAASEVQANRLFDADAQVRPRLWRSCSLRAGQLRR